MFAWVVFTKRPFDDTRWLLEAWDTTLEYPGVKIQEFIVANEVRFPAGRLVLPDH